MPNALDKIGERGICGGERRHAMFKLTAKLRTNADHEMSQYGSATYTIITDEAAYPYTLANLKFTKATGEWTVYGFHRNDIGFSFDEANSRTFDDRAAALAFIRDTYEEAHSRYAAACAEVLAHLRADLSPVEFVGYLKEGASTPKQPQIIIEVITTGKDRFTFRMVVTIQEALTALDYLYARTNGRLVVNIVGRVTTSYVHNRCGFAKWVVPAMSQDYQIDQWRSRTGEGRRQTNAFYAALQAPCHAK